MRPSCPSRTSARPTAGLRVGAPTHQNYAHRRRGCPFRPVQVALLLAGTGRTPEPLTAATRPAPREGAVDSDGVRAGVTRRAAPGVDERGFNGQIAAEMRRLDAAPSGGSDCGSLRERERERERERVQAPRDSPTCEETATRAAPSRRCPDAVLRCASGDVCEWMAAAPATAPTAASEPVRVPRAAVPAAAAGLSASQRPSSPALRRTSLAWPGAAALVQRRAGIGMDAQIMRSRYEPL